MMEAIIFKKKTFVPCSHLVSDVSKPIVSA